MNRVLPKNVQQLRFSDRAAWHLARGKDVTASVAGALFDAHWLNGPDGDLSASASGAFFGVHEYCSPYDLWANKAGLLFRDDINSAAILRGNMLEPVAVEMLKRERPDWEIIHNTGENEIYFRDPVNRIGATPDTLVMCPERGPGTVQLKSVAGSTYRKNWTPEGSDPEPPLWIAIQAIVEAHLTGSHWACVAPLVVDYGIELPVINIPLVESVIPSLIEKTAQFWSLIDSGQEPPPDYSRDRAVIENMHPVDDGTEIDLVSDRRVYTLIEERATLTDAIKAHEARKEEIDAELKHRMGGAALAYLPNGMRMTWRTYRQTEPDGRKKVYRVLRVPRPKDLVLPPAPMPEPKPARTGNARNDDWKF